MGKARNVFGYGYDEQQNSRQRKFSAARTRQLKSGTSSIITPTINNQRNTGENGTLNKKVNRGGDVMQGMICFTSLIGEIDSGVLNITSTGDLTLYDVSAAGQVTSNRVYVLGEGSVNDDLVTISPPQFGESTVLFLSMKNGFGNITVKTTGNIYPHGGVEFTMTNQNNIHVFVWDVGLLKWVQTAINPNIIAQTLSVSGNTSIGDEPLTDTFLVVAKTSFFSGVNYNVSSSASASYTVLDSDYTIRCTSSGNQTFNLPSAVGRTGRVYIFYKTLGTGTVTIDASGTQTINGALTTTLTTQYQKVTIQSDGSNWMII